MISFIQRPDRMATELLGRVKHGYAILLRGSGFIVLAITMVAQHNVHADNAKKEQSVVFSEIGSGNIYICRPSDIKVGGDILVSVQATRIGKGETSTYILPVPQAFDRYPFRWRLHQNTLYFLTCSLFPSRQDQFALHRVPVECLTSHDVSLLPRRETFESEEAFEDRLRVAVQMAADKRIVASTRFAAKNALPISPYAIESHFVPVVSALGTSKDGFLSYDITFPQNDIVQCFVSDGRTLASWTAKLKMQEITAKMVVGKPEAWTRIASEACEFNQRCWVFNVEDGFIFISESGELFKCGKGENIQASGDLSKESPIVCIVGDAGNNKVFAFSREHYMELKSPLQPQPCRLSEESSDSDRLQLARRCARFLLEAGLLKNP